MNYNEFSSIGLQNIADPINSRAKLDTGTHCNYECNFCYYIDRLDQVTDLAKIKERALKLKQFGMQEIDLSGGESSIHKDWFLILSYCQELGFSSISALTNGSRFHQFEFLKKSKEHGLSELLISLHGKGDEAHAQIVKRPGAFSRIMQTIDNARALDIKVRLNCTVTHFNAPHLGEYAALVNTLMPSQLNFLPLNYWEDAKNSEPQDYRVLSDAIKKAIDLVDPAIEVNVRYIPFCFMQGYEKHVVGIYQHIFDQGDWNIIAYDVDDLELRSVELKDYFQKAREQRIYTYFKTQKCLDCKYFNICDGVEKKIIASTAYTPVVGEKIKDVQYYRRDYIKARS